MAETPTGLRLPDLGAVREDEGIHVNVWQSSNRLLPSATHS